MDSVDEDTSRTAHVDDDNDNDNNDTSSFQALLKSIQVLEKQSRSKEQQLTNKLEQERLRWQQERQQLIDQLNKLPSPYKVPKSPARPVLGSLSFNKQPASSTKSQAPSDISFQDIFSPSTKVPPSPRQGNNNNNTTPSKRHLTSNTSTTTTTTLISLNKLSAELEATQKELKRVKHKYYSLYEAQEEILRKRNKDRDRWRHFKLVVKHVCADKPEFQDALREADALLKKQHGIEGQKTPTKPVPVKVPVNTEISLEKQDVVPSSSTASARHPEINAHRSPHKSTFTSPRRPLRTPERRTQVPAPSQPILSPRPLSSPPQSPSPKKRTVGNTSLRPMSQGSEELVLPASLSKKLSASSETTTPKVPARASTPVNRASSRDDDMRSRSECVDAHSLLKSLHEQDDYLKVIDDHLDYLAREAFQEAEEEADLAHEEEVMIGQVVQEELDKQVIGRIYAEYASSSGLPVSLPRGDTSALWKLDGQEIHGPVLPDLHGTAGLDGQNQTVNKTRPSPSLSLPSTCDNLSFWSEEDELATSKSQESVPTDIEFGSYIPSTADLSSDETAMQVDKDDKPVPNAAILPNNILDSKKTTSETIASPYFGNITRPNAHIGGIPYLYPLPEDLQPRISADVDILEESMPIHRINRRRIRNSSVFTPPPVTAQEKFNKPQKSRGCQERLPAAGPLASGREQAEKPNNSQICDDEATEPSSASSEEGDNRDMAVNQAIALLSEDARPSPSTVPASSTVKSRSASEKSSNSPIRKPVPSETGQDIEMEKAAMRVDLPGVITRSDDAQNVQNLLLPSTVAAGKNVQPRLSSYRLSKGLDSDEEYSTRSISDERIGPRRALAPTSTAKAKPTSTRASRLLGLPDTPKEDLCEAFYTKITAGPPPIRSHDSPMPLGKAIVLQQQQHQNILASAIQRGTPTAWLNMSSRKRNASVGPEAGTPVHSSAANSFKQARDISEASETVKIRQATAKQTQNGATPGNGDTAQRPRKSVHSALATELQIGNRESPSIRAKPKASSSATQLNAHEIAAGYKKSTVKKLRKSALVNDPDVQSDLDTIGAVIMNGSGSTFKLGQKRAAQATVTIDDQTRKKARKSNDQRSVDSLDDIKPAQIVKNIAPLVAQKKLSGNDTVNRRGSTKTMDRGTADPFNTVANKQHTSPFISNNAAPDVKEEELDLAMPDEESEEYQGQNFMRNIHKLRKQQMAEKAARRPGRAADGDSEPELARKEVAYKETVRGREARQAMHGVECDCCKGYYEYKTRHLPIEQRQQAALEMVNDVSRHRQNWDTAESPPGFWQMGFPNTQEVQRINEEAGKMTVEKEEKQQKEKKHRANQCDGRFDYKVV